MLARKRMNLTRMTSSALDPTLGYDSRLATSSSLSSSPRPARPAASLRARPSSALPAQKERAPCNLSAPHQPTHSKEGAEDAHVRGRPVTGMAVLSQGWHAAVNAAPATS